MIHSKRSMEGVLLIDNSANSGGKVEMAVLTCAHCHKQLIVNPLRNRARGYCGKCNHYVCDQCETVRVISGECNNLNAVMDKIQNEIGRNLNLKEI